MNSVLLVGKISRKPIVKTLDSGKTVVNFVVVTSETYEKNGEVKTIEQYNKVVAWGKAAEVAKDLFEGNIVGITGKLSNRSYENQMGDKTYITEVSAINIMIIDSSAPAENTSEDVASPVSKDEENPDDIPF